MCRVSEAAGRIPIRPGAAAGRKQNDFNRGLRRCAETMTWNVKLRTAPAGRGFEVGAKGVQFGLLETEGRLHSLVFGLFAKLSRLLALGGVGQVAEDGVNRGSPLDRIARRTLDRLEQCSPACEPRFQIGFR